MTATDVNTNEEKESAKLRAARKFFMIDSPVCVGRTHQKNAGLGETCERFLYLGSSERMQELSVAQRLGIFARVFCGQRSRRHAELSGSPALQRWEQGIN